MVSKDNKDKKLKALGQKIRQARIKKDWTQSDLAAILNVDNSLVSHWETGKKAPGALTLIELIKKLNLKV